jgi:hypothetical protein
MRNGSKLLLAAFTATALLSLAVSSASARRLEISNTNFRIVWTSLEFIAPFTRVLCPVTLEGRFHSRTISKVSGQLIGYVTSAFVGSACTGGSGRALTETLPWHVQYLGFRGTLPIIEGGIRLILVGARFRIINGGGTACLAGTTQASPGGAIATPGAGGLIRTLRADESLRIPLEGGFSCAIAGSGTFQGTGEVFLQGTTTRIFVRLVQ